MIVFRSFALYAVFTSARVDDSPTLPAPAWTASTENSSTAAATRAAQLIFACIAPPLGPQTVERLSPALAEKSRLVGPPPAKRHERVVRRHCGTLAQASSPPLGGL